MWTIIPETSGSSTAPKSQGKSFPKHGSVFLIILIITCTFYIIKRSVETSPIRFNFSKNKAVDRNILGWRTDPYFNHSILSKYFQYPGSLNPFVSMMINNVIYENRQTINKILDELRNSTINSAETNAGYVNTTAGIQYIYIHIIW